MVLGKTQHDQDWIDGNVEAGIGACYWPRPQPRPKEWDVETAAAGPSPRTTVAAEKMGLLRRARQKVSRGVAKARQGLAGRASAAPVSTPSPVPYIAPSVAPPVTAQPLTPSPPAQPPQDPVDALLHPRK